MSLAVAQLPNGQGAAAAAEGVLAAFWRELRRDPRLADLAALVPADRALGIADAMGLLPAVLAILSGPERQLAALDAVTGAYLRANGIELEATTTR